MVNHKVFLFGLDNAGKTTLSNYIIDRTLLENPEPTKTVNINPIVLKDFDFIFWDAPGQERYRDKWSRQVLDTKILLFVIDTADKERIKEAKKELDKVLNDLETRGMPLIVCFHKMDLKEAQDNLTNAYATLRLKSIDDRDVYWIESSVYEEETMINVENQLVEIVEKSRWG